MGLYFLIIIKLILLNFTTRYTIAVSLQILHRFWRNKSDKPVRKFRYFKSQEILVTI